MLKQYTLHAGTRAKKAADKFAEAGFSEAVVIEGGTQAWEDAGLPVERDAKAAVLPLDRQLQLVIGALVVTGVLLSNFVNPNWIWLSGFVGVHHFSTIGNCAFVAGMSAVRHDVPPYMLMEGCPAKPRCINVVGLKRNNFPEHVIQSLSEAHRLLYRAKVGLDNAWEILRNNGQLVPQVNHLLSFVQSQHEGMHGRGRERRRAA